MSLAASDRAGTPTTPAKTFVLVHGAWHGGWCWRRVMQRLQAEGHTVFAPTLTGVGERSHLLTKDVDLATHVTDIVNVIKWERLSEVVLVGHSYGGVVIAGVAEQLPDKIASIVFLDAFVPENGDSLAGKASQQTRDALAATRANNETAVKPISAAFFRVNEADRAWVDAMCTPHPLATFTGPLAVTGACDRIGKRTYIRAKGYPSVPFDTAYEKAKAANGWSTYELPCGHDAMIDLPDQLAEIFLEVA